MKKNNKLQIYGLQAIAVVSIILYHAQITIYDQQLFKGGFIGVDIFFVLSGYLITSIILKELITTVSFSFKNFYERRIRQIFPVLLLVILASLPFAWIYLLPTDLNNFSESIITLLSFSSNFYFHYSGNAFGESGSLSKPFIHTWLISVLAQYYIIFPIILLIVFRYFRKYLIHILILGFVISLVMADSGSRNYPSFNFYVLPTRGWELLAGSIMAYYVTILGQSSNNKTLNLERKIIIDQSNNKKITSFLFPVSRAKKILYLILPSVGLFLIGHSILFFNDEMFHPSFYTLPPIIGVCLIIWFSNKDEIITKILSTKLFVGIGLISYSLYLWHYPIFAFARIVEFPQGDVFKKIILGIVIISLSIVTYFFIERPARNKKFKFKFVLLFVLFFSFVLISLNSKIILKDGYIERLPEILQKNFVAEKPWNLLKNLDGKKCFTNMEGCKFNTTSNKKVYAVGDSHIASLTFNLKERVVIKNYQFVTSNIACLYLPEFNVVKTKTQKINELCNDFYFKKLKEILSKETNSILIFGGRFPLYLSNNYFNNQEGGVEGNKWEDKYVSIGKYKTIQNSFTNEVLELSRNNNIILVYPIPETAWDVSEKLSKFFRTLPKNVNNKIFNTSNFITTSFDVYKNRTKSSFELLNSIQGDNIYRVYPHKLFCDTLIKDRCVLHNDKDIFYSDDDHPSIKGVEMINDLILKEIEKIEKNSN